MSLASFRFQFGDARSSVNLFHLEDAMHQFSFWVYYPISALSSILTLILDVEPNFCFWNAIYKVYCALFRSSIFLFWTKRPTALHPGKPSAFCVLQMFLLEHPQQAHLEAALRRDAVETVLVEAEPLACVQLIILHESSSFLYLWPLKFLKKSQAQAQKPI